MLAKMEELNELEKILESEEDLNNDYFMSNNNVVIKQEAMFDETMFEEPMYEDTMYEETKYEDTIYEETKYKDTMYEESNLRQQIYSSSCDDIPLSERLYEDHPLPQSNLSPKIENSTLNRDIEPKVSLHQFDVNMTAISRKPE